MPVEQGLPWHPVATGLAGQAIPFFVAASHAHALPSLPFWFPVPAVAVASPALLCPSSLFAVLALVPPGVAPVLCVSVLLLPLSVGAPGCPCRTPPPVPPACPPPYEGFTSPYNMDCPVRGWLVMALLPPPWRAPPGARGAAPALVEYVPLLPAIAWYMPKNETRVQKNRPHMKFFHGKFVRFFLYLSCICKTKSEHFTKKKSVRVICFCGKCEYPVLQCSPIQFCCTCVYRKTELHDLKHTFGRARQCQFGAGGGGGGGNAACHKSHPARDKGVVLRWRPEIAWANAPPSPSPSL